MLVGIQPISEEDIFRKPHHILFWLYADMLNFGKKVMKFSQLHRRACVHIDTHTQGERDTGWFCSWKEIPLQINAPLFDTCWTVGHYLNLDCPLQGLCLQDRTEGASLWSPRPPNVAWHCGHQQPLQGRLMGDGGLPAPHPTSVHLLLYHLWEQKEVTNATVSLFSLGNWLSFFKSAYKVLERGPKELAP